MSMHCTSSGKKIVGECISTGNEYALYFRWKEDFSVKTGCLIWGSQVIIPSPDTMLSTEINIRLNWIG